MRIFLTTFCLITIGLSLSLFYALAYLGYDKTLTAISNYRRMFLQLSEYTPLNLHAGRYLSVLEPDKSVLGQYTISAGLKLETEEMTAPFIVPSSGIAGHKDFLYIPEHPGIDIWTNPDGKPLPGKKHGNPVYAACGGYVYHYKPDNEEVEIVCDPIPAEFAGIVPSLQVKILYSHLGNGATGDSFHSLKVGQRVEMGELVGYQGDKSSFVPENRVVHLHFGVYDLSVGGRPSPLDPADYIGVPTTILGQTYHDGVNE